MNHIQWDPNNQESLAQPVAIAAVTTLLVWGILALMGWLNLGSAIASGLVVAGVTTWLHR